jgi:DNA-binding NarL/FixJ family response regulator
MGGDCLVGFGSVCRTPAKREEPLSRSRVLLADDHEAFLAVEARLLEPEFEVVTTARDGRAVLEEVARLAPDILLLDISMPVLDGIQAARLLKAFGCQANIFMTVHGDQDYVQAGLAAGALGYVVKSRLATDLLPALREVLAGRCFVSPSISMA